MLFRMFSSKNNLYISRKDLLTLWTTKAVHMVHKAKRQINSVKEIIQKYNRTWL